MNRFDADIRQKGLAALRDRLGEEGMRQFMAAIGVNVSDDSTAAPNGGASTNRSIEERLAAIAGSVPQEEWDSPPHDLTDDLDHYVHGAPRRSAEAQLPRVAPC